MTATELLDPETEAPGSVDAAKAEVDRLYALETTWTARWVAARAEVTATQTTAGAAVLDGGDPEDLVRESALAHGRVSVAEVAIAELRRRRVVAILAVWQAEAAALRLRAQSLRAEADERQKTTDQHLAALQDHEGVTYVPAASVSHWSGSGVYADPPRVPFRTPKTVLLRDEAAALEANAAAREAQKVSDRGQVDATSRGALLATLDARGAMALSPARHLVLAWLDEAEPLDRARRTRLNVRRHEHARGDDERPSRYRLTWREGLIDARATAIDPPEEW